MVNIDAICLWRNTIQLDMIGYIELAIAYKFVEMITAVRYSVQLSQKIEVFI